MPSFSSLRWRLPPPLHSTRIVYTHLTTNPKRIWIANPRTPAPQAAAPTTRRHAGGETRPMRSSPTLHAPPSQRSLAGSRQNAGSSAFQTWVAHDRRRSRPLAISAVENPRSISGETRSETPLSGALAEEHGDNEERNSYGQNGRLGKVRRPHDGSGYHRKRLMARL
ncbi:hypothetical protein F2Q68_00046072 [Brassica cretica]|uniref:Uncharacterized protein n=1 Tax=Brassica cretica TaxID=69181 RepID=A0A8S9LET2_BRACR|nr:hypothetical protein F2Q68_00046072 [Brassica cretica]